MNELKKHLLESINISFPEEVKRAFLLNKGMLADEMSQDDCDELLNNPQKVAEIVYACNHPLRPALQMLSQKLLSFYIETEKNLVIKSYWLHLELYAHINPNNSPKKDLQQQELFMEKLIERMDASYNQKTFEKVLFISALYIDYIFDLDWVDNLVIFYKSVYNEEPLRAFSS